MKTQQIKSLGLTLNISVPATVEEFDSNAKKVGACLEQANANILYRGVLAEFRSAFCEAVEKAFGVERKTKDTGRTKTVTTTVDGKPVETKESVFAYDESEANYIDRVIATKAISRESLQPIADALLTEVDDKGVLKIAFDASATEAKVSGPKKLAQKYADAAKQVIDLGKVDGFNAKLKKAGMAEFVATEDAEKNIIDLGWKVKAFMDWSEAQALAKMIG